MNDAARRRQIRRRKRIIKVWAAGVVVLTVAAALIFAILMGIKALIVNAGSSDEEIEIVEIVSEEVAEAESIIAIEEVKEDPVKFQDIHSMDWDADDAYLLAKIAMAEAEGESTEGKAMVIMVVLNRVYAEGFENTIEGVILEHHTNENGKEVYQFTPVQPGGRWYTVEPDADCWQALRMIEMEGWDESEGALYFEAADREGEWHRSHLEYIKTVGNHNFYR